MKKVLFPLLSLGVISGSAMAQTTAPTTERNVVSVSSPVLRQGEITPVEVVIKNPEDVAGIQINITYDPAVARVVSDPTRFAGDNPEQPITETTGSVLGQTSGATNYNYTEVCPTGRSCVYTAIAASSGRGTTRSGRLYRIWFEPAPGVASGTTTTLDINQVAGNFVIAGASPINGETNRAAPGANNRVDAVRNGIARNVAATATTSVSIGIAQGLSGSVSTDGTNIYLVSDDGHLRAFSPTGAAAAGFTNPTSIIGPLSQAQGTAAPTGQPANLFATRPVHAPVEGRPTIRGTADTGLPALGAFAAASLPQAVELPAPQPTAGTPQTTPPGNIRAVGKVGAWNAVTGANIWATQINPAGGASTTNTTFRVRSTPAVANSQVYVTDNEDRVHVLNATTGAVLNAGGGTTTTFQISQGATGTNPGTSSPSAFAPAGAASTVWVGGINGAYQLTAGTTGQLTQSRVVTTNSAVTSPITSAPGGNIFFGTANGSVYVADAAGTVIGTPATTTAGSAVEAAPYAISATEAVVLNTNGRLFRITVNGTTSVTSTEITGTGGAAFVAGSTFRGAPIVVGGTTYVPGSAGNLVTATSAGAVGTNTQIAGSSTPITSPVILGGNQIVVGALNNTVTGMPTAP